MASMGAVPKNAGLLFQIAYVDSHQLVDATPKLVAAPTEDGVIAPGEIGVGTPGGGAGGLDIGAGGNAFATLLAWGAT